jgi:predicted double-glycine peptidase
MNAEPHGYAFRAQSLAHTSQVPVIVYVVEYMPCMIATVRQVAQERQGAAFACGG